MVGGGDPFSGASILWGMTHVASLKFKRGGKMLKILHNVMQRPVGHDQRAYSQTWIQDLLIQDQDQDSEVPRPRPRPVSRPRPRLKTYKTNTGSA